MNLPFFLKASNDGPMTWLSAEAPSSSSSSSLSQGGVAPAKTHQKLTASLLHQRKNNKPPKYFFRTLSASSSSSPLFPRFAFTSALFTLLSRALHALCSCRQDASQFLFKATHKLRLHWAFLQRGKNVTACVTSRSQDKFTVYYTMET